MKLVRCAICDERVAAGTAIHSHSTKRWFCRDLVACNKRAEKKARADRSARLLAMQTGTFKAGE